WLQPRRRRRCHREGRRGREAGERRWRGDPRVAHGEGPGQLHGRHGAGAPVRADPRRARRGCRGQGAQDLAGRRRTADDRGTGAAGRRRVRAEGARRAGREDAGRRARQRHRRPGVPGGERGQAGRAGDRVRAAVPGARAGHGPAPVARRHRARQLHRQAAGRHRVRRQRGAGRPGGLPARPGRAGLAGRHLADAGRQQVPFLDPARAGLRRDGHARRPDPAERHVGVRGRAGRHRVSRPDWLAPIEPRGSGRMRVAIFGTGYVGLVTGTCLAEVGHDVVCVDVDEAKVEGLRRGEVPIYEPGLEPMVRANHAEGRLHFTTDAAEAVAHGRLVFIAVGTPPDEDGSADLQYVLAVARTIGEHMTRPLVVVNKSTVPVGTADKVRETIATTLAERGVDIAFDVVSNPEFLKEGAAVEDCMRPDRIVIGADSDEAVERLRRLYAPFNRNRDRIVAMDVRSAELTKYAANAMLATKISLLNEIANIAEKVRAHAAERAGADAEHGRRGIGSDQRIGWHFIYPGAGYGGSCCPKDVQALARTAQQHGHAPRLLEAVEAVNAAQKGHLFELVQRHYDAGEDEGVRGKTFAVWGLAFKPDTDDMREAPSRRLLEQLWEAGARVRA